MCSRATFSDLASLLHMSNILHWGFATSAGECRETVYLTVRRWFAAWNILDNKRMWRFIACVMRRPLHPWHVWATADRQSSRSIIIEFDAGFSQIVTLINLNMEAKTDATTIRSFIRSTIYLTLNRSGVFHATKNLMGSVSYKWPQRS